MGDPTPPWEAPREIPKIQSTLEFSDTGSHSQGGDVNSTQNGNFIESFDWEKGCGSV